MSTINLAQRDKAAAFLEDPANASATGLDLAYAMGVNMSEREQLALELGWSPGATHPTPHSFLCGIR